MWMEYRCEWVRGSAAGEALEIRRRVYMEELGFALGGTGPGDSHDARALHLVARTETGEAVASLRLLEPTARPFEIEQFIDLSAHLNPSWRPAEITRLCILAAHRRITEASFVHLALLRSVLDLTRRLDVTHIVAWTRPELMSFYKYVLFDAYPDVTFTHPGIRDARHTMVMLELATFGERCRVQRPTLYRAMSDALGDTIR